MHPLVKRIAQAIILFSICLCAIGLPLPLQAQMDSLVFMTDARIDASQRGEIRLNVDNLTFLRDNEYKGRLVKGYTLPGIWIEPTVSYQPLDNLKVEAGMHLLHYWGANVYPNLNYSSIPTWQNGRIQKSFHALPLFRAQMQLTPSLNLVVGTLYGKQNHGLIAPLYNDELNLSSDPESGLQLLWHTRPFSLDAWLNWESFIFRGDDHQESFTFGFSSRIHPSKPSKRTQVYLPVQVLFHHRGGEINSEATERSIKTWLNAAAGIGVDYSLACPLPVRLHAEGDVAVYRQQAGTALPFSSGWGAQMKVAADVWRCRLTMSYWQCHDFISIFGNPLYGAMSIDEDGLTAHNPKLLTLRAEYAQQLGKGFAWGIHADLFGHLKADGCSSEAGKVSLPMNASLAAGIYVRIHPSFLLKGASRKSNSH